MKKLLSFLALALLLCNCSHKDLCYHHPHDNYLNIIVNWGTRAATIPEDGIRVNFGLLEGTFAFGVRDLPSFGGMVICPYDNTYTTFCYDYRQPENVFVKNESDYTIMEAYTKAAVRASYSVAYPDEQLVEEPDRFYLSKVSPFLVAKAPEQSPQELVFNMVNRVESYTIEIRGVKGVEYISSFGGAISGVSGSYFLDAQTIADDVKTVLFNAEASKTTQSIVGEFNIFGHCQDAHNKNFLTMEIRFSTPDPLDGYRMGRWDVTDQMHNGTHHIIIDWDTQIDPNPDGTGMEVDVQDWNDLFIPLII